MTVNLACKELVGWGGGGGGGVWLRQIEYSSKHPLPTLDWKYVWKGEVYYRELIDICVV